VKVLVNNKWIQSKIEIKLSEPRSYPISTDSGGYRSNRNHIFF